MKPQIFLDAAELIETYQQNCCCYAIANLESGTEAELFFCELFFCDVFSPIEGDYRAGSYNVFWMRMGCATDDEVRARRVFALCMAATLAADESFLSS